jgi:hypothetical protein
MSVRQIDNGQSFHYGVIVSPVIVIPDWLWADARQVAKNCKWALARDSFSRSSIGHLPHYADIPVCDMHAQLW